jgi:hypothetical protein
MCFNEDMNDQAVREREDMVESLGISINISKTKYEIAMSDSAPGCTIKDKI